MRNEIVGLDAELGSIESFLNLVPNGPYAILIEGEAGIGKTTLVKAGVEAATERQYRVLSSRPARSEVRLSLTGLRGPESGDTRASLPAGDEERLGVYAFQPHFGGGDWAFCAPDVTEGHIPRGGRDG